MALAYRIVKFPASMAGNDGNRFRWRRYRQSVRIVATWSGVEWRWPVGKCDGRRVETADDLDHGDAELNWAKRVARLESELAGLRRAMRGRALIEQAKGLLAGTLDCTPDAAFEHLSRLSQHENRRLVEVAARILGSAVPDGPDDPPPGPAGDFDPTTYLDGAAVDPGTGAGDTDDPGLAGLSATERVRLHTAVAAARTATNLGQLADRLLAEGVGELGGTAVLVGVTEPDGALRLAACAGLAAQWASDWQRIPSPVPTPLGGAIGTDQPVWVTGDTPPGQLLIGPGPTRACLPLRHAGRPFGGIEVVWAEPHELTEADRGYLTALATGVARRAWQLSRLVADVPAAPGHWLQAAFEAVPAPLYLLSPVRDDAGAVVDFAIDFASGLAGEAYEQDPAELVGARLLDVRPDLAVAGIFDEYRQVLLTGTPWQRPVRTETILVGGVARPALISRSAVRLGDGLLVCWQRHDAEAELARAAVVADLARLGYAEWDPASGELHWSTGMYRIFDRSPARGPLPLDEIPAQVLPDDLPAVQDELRKLISEGQPAEVQFRIQTRSGPRTLRVLVRPALDGGDDGEVPVVQAVVQDITELALRVDLARRGSQAAAIRRMHKGPGGARRG
jgi:PAS domain-containing protein